MFSPAELEKLDRIAANSWYGRGVSARMVEYSFRVFSRYLRGDNVLELGPAEGLMTNLLAPVVKRLTLVEGAATFCDDLRRRFPGTRVVHSLFEDFRPEEQFDCIILGHVLEHVEDPLAVMRLVKSWLAPAGRVLAAVPNARSLHRQAAVLMGMLLSEDSMNETDAHHGHRRVFNPDNFRNVFLQAGLKIEVFGGYWMKPVSNRQIEETWTAEMLEAFMPLGERYPDIAAEVYIVAENPH
jgi:2-polyprenyl-3-methyl-5-hydroxy-6-metoxy-1,4-benzoquinol methylase